LSAFFPLRFDLLLDWFYPPRCRFCKEVILGQDDKCFCESCRGKIRVVSHPLCSKCGQPFLDASGEDHLCGGGGNRYASPTSYRAAVQVRGKSVLGKAPGETDGQGLLRVFLRLAFGLHCPCPSPSTKAALEGI